MKSKHTPGPWNASKTPYQGLIISWVTGSTVAVTYDVKDADLVAAAPELLEVLEKLLAATSGHQEIRDVAYAAINKAKGL